MHCAGCIGLKAFLYENRCLEDEVPCNSNLYKLYFPWDVNRVYREVSATYQDFENISEDDRKYINSLPLGNDGYSQDVLVDSSGSVLKSFFLFLEVEQMLFFRCWNRVQSCVKFCSYYMTLKKVNRSTSPLGSARKKVNCALMQIPECKTKWQALSSAFYLVSQIVYLCSYLHPNVIRISG